MTPRDSVKAFVGLLSVLEQNPGTDWHKLLSGIQIEITKDPAIVQENVSNEQTESDDELTSFKL